jgi:hypoxanthine-guanine phosphoribosyltransferase
MNLYWLYDDGFDLDERKNTVEFTEDHQKLINTLLEVNPVEYDFKVGDKPFHVISLFSRKSYPSSILQKNIDGNPVIKALKNLEGWSFINKANRQAFYNRMGEIASKLAKRNFDTLILVPSSNALNGILATQLRDKLNCKYLITSLFQKLPIGEVKSGGIAWEKLDKDIREGKTEKRVKTILKNSLEHMVRFFEVKHINAEYRSQILPYITAFMGTNPAITPSVLATQLKDKKVLVFDDTLTSGATISKAVNLILETKELEEFKPESLTVLTLFSAKDIKGDVIDDYEWLPEWDDSDYYLDLLDNY